MLRTFTKRLIVLLAAIYLAAGAYAQDFSFAYLSDVHISVGSGSVDDARESSGKSLDELFREVFACL